MSGINVECSSTLEPAEDFVQAHEVKAWLEGIPDGAVIDYKARDFGNQRDPDPRLSGLVARWSETRHGDS